MKRARGRLRPLRERVSDPEKRRDRIVRRSTPEAEAAREERREAARASFARARASVVQPPRKSKLLQTVLDAARQGAKARES